MAATSETLSLLDKLIDATAAVTDAQARDIAKAYATAWDEVAQELEDALETLLSKAKDGYVPRAVIARSERLSKTIAIIEDQLRSLAAEAGDGAIKELDKVIKLAGDLEYEQIRSMLPKIVDVADLQSFSMVNEKTVDAIIRRTTQQIEKRTKALPADQAKAMKRELIRGIAVGRNPNAVAARIVKRTQGTFEGGAARAARIARTEMLDAMRAGARAVDLANKDVMKGWRWVAELDPRSCAACVGMHGRVFPLDSPGPEGHPNCRCARSPVTKSWKDLGFDVKEPPDLLPDAEKWFRKLPTADKERLIGADGLKAYNAGNFPLDKWAVRKDNAQWRPSYVPAKP